MNVLDKNNQVKVWQLHGWKKKIMCYASFESRDYNHRIFQSQQNNFWCIYTYFWWTSVSFDTYVGLQGGHLACSNRVFVCCWWWSDWSFARIIVPFWLHCQISSCCGKIQNGLTLWCNPTQVVLFSKLPKNFLIFS